MTQATHTRQIQSQKPKMEKKKKNGGGEENIISQGGKNKVTYQVVSVFWPV